MQSEWNNWTWSIFLPFLQDGYMYYGHKKLYLNHPTFSQDHSEVDADPSPYPFGDFNRGQIDVIIDMKCYFCGIAAATITNDYGFLWPIFLWHSFWISTSWRRQSGTGAEGWRLWSNEGRWPELVPWHRGADSEEFSKIRMKTDRRM